MSRTWPKHNHEFATFQKRARARAQIYKIDSVLVKNEDPSQANKENEHVKLTMFEGKFVKLERSLPPLDLEPLLESYGMYELYFFELII